MVNASSLIWVCIMPAGFELGAPRVTRLRRMTFRMRKKRRNAKFEAASVPLNSKSIALKQTAMMFGKVVTMSTQELRVKKKSRFECAKTKSLAKVTAKNNAAKKSTISILAIVDAFLAAKIDVLLR